MVMAYRFALSAAAFVSVGMVATAAAQDGAPAGATGFVAAAEHGGPAVASASALVDEAAARGDLVPAGSFAASGGGRREFYRWTVAGVPVLSGSVARFVDADGLPVFVSGAVERAAWMDDPGLAAAAAALVSGGWAAWERAVAGFEQRTGLHAAPRSAVEAAAAAVGGPAAPPAVVLPPAPVAGARGLAAWEVPASDLRRYYVGSDGDVIWFEDAVSRQHGPPRAEGGVPVVGAGIGYDGEQKLLSVWRGGGEYRAHDLRRVPGIYTFDGAFNARRVTRLVGCEGRAPVGLERRLLAHGPGNFWPPTVTDAHAHLGWSYDYFRRLHDWWGLYARAVPVVAVINPVGSACVGGVADNAFWVSPPWGPFGQGVAVFGLAESGRSGFRPLVGLDVVAHELTHGVVNYAVRARTGSSAGLRRHVVRRSGARSYLLPGGVHVGCTPEPTPVRYRVAPSGEERYGHVLCRAGRLQQGFDDGGAVNEALADVFAVAVSRDAARRGLPVAADWAVGSIRSLRRPDEAERFLGGYPAHWDHRYEQVLFWDPDWPWFVGCTNAYVRYRADGVVLAGPVDGMLTGVSCLSHPNSTVLSHAFYLSVAGRGAYGTAPGVYVEGVGDAERDLVEAVWFRAVRDLFPASVTLHQAAAIIRQAAREQMGPFGHHAVYRAVSDAFRAVGLDSGPG